VFTVITIHEFKSIYKEIIHQREASRTEKDTRNTQDNKYIPI